MPNQALRRQHKDRPAHQHDLVFFIKEQITIGTILVSHGRKDNGTRWRVVRILKQPDSRPVRKIHTMHDTVFLEKMGIRKEEIGSATRRSCSFTNLSYSAIWRLAA